MVLNRKNCKREHVNLTLSKEVAEKIDSYADEYGMSRSYAIEYMCRGFLKNIEKECADDDRNRAGCSR